MNSRAFRVFRRHKAALAGLAVLALMVVLAAVAGWASPYDPARWEAGAEGQGLSWEHPLGTDEHGRDIATRLCHGARLSLFIGLFCVVVSLAIGVPLGAAAGFFGGWVDWVVSRAVDVMLSLPEILLAICLAAALGPGLKTVILAVGVVGIPQFARQVRASVLSIREMDYVQASRALMAGRMRLLCVDIVPNALGPIVILGSLAVGSSILGAAGLSFLGLGVEPGTPEWGAMLRDGYLVWRRSALLAVSSGLAISLAVLAFNLLGDGLRDALDPRFALGEREGRGGGDGRTGS